MNAPPTNCEVVNPSLPRGGFRFALFDFDGTLSLIREGWPDVMIPMMVEVLRATPRAEDAATLRNQVEEFVMRLNGRQTIYQMIQLADEVQARGGTAAEPIAYKHRYHDLLMARIQSRLDSLTDGSATVDDWTVPGSRALLTGLRDGGLQLYLASGTDRKYVLNECGLLHLLEFFGEHVYGALDDYWNFSKRMVIERILQEHAIAGEQLIGFGDGYVEIEEIKRVGGLAIGVASDEAKRQGVNAWKRDRLVRAGADVIIPDYREHEALLGWLLGG